MPFRSSGDQKRPLKALIRFLGTLGFYLPAWGNGSEGLSYRYRGAGSFIGGGYAYQIECGGKSDCL